MKSKKILLILWCLSFFGCLGFHRIYMGKHISALIWMSTCGFFFIGGIIDFFMLDIWVYNYNTNYKIKKLIQSYH